MDIVTFYKKLGELCRGRDGRGYGCEGCPAREFCYSAPGSVTDDMLDALIKVLSVPTEGGAMKRSNTDAQIHSSHCTLDVPGDLNM